MRKIIFVLPDKKAALMFGNMDHSKPYDRLFSTEVESLSSSWQNMSQEKTRRHLQNIQSKYPGEHPSLIPFANARKL